MKRPETTKKKIGENQIEGIIYKEKPYNNILPPPLIIWFFSVILADFVIRDSIFIIF
jgi:hypothetical protein